MRLIWWQPAWRKLVSAPAVHLCQYASIRSTEVLRSNEYRVHGPVPENTQDSYQEGTGIPLSFWHKDSFRAQRVTVYLISWTELCPRACVLISGQPSPFDKRDYRNGARFLMDGPVNVGALSGRDAAGQAPCWVIIRALKHESDIQNLHSSCFCSLRRGSLASVYKEEVVPHTDVRLLLILTWTKIWLRSFTVEFFFLIALSCNHINKKERKKKKQFHLKGASCSSCIIYCH